MQLHSGCGPIIGDGGVVRNAESASAAPLPAPARSDDRPTFPQVTKGHFRQNVNFYEGPPPTAMQLHSGNRPTIGGGQVVRNAESASGALLYESTKRPGSPFPHLGKCRSRFVSSGCEQFLVQATVSVGDCGRVLVVVRMMVTSLGSPVGVLGIAVMSPASSAARAALMRLVSYCFQVPSSTLCGV